LFYSEILERCKFPSVEEISLVSLTLRHLCGLPLNTAETALLKKYCVPTAPPVLTRALLYKYGHGIPVELGQASFSQLLLFCLLLIDTKKYDASGGAIERSLVYELALQLSTLNVLDGAPLYEIAPPEGKGRVDLLVDSRFNAFVEALVHDAASLGTKTAQAYLLKHINRFLPNLQTNAIQYGCGDNYWILSFQRHGNTPEAPTKKWAKEQQQVFHTKTLTWLMTPRKLYLGLKEVMEHNPNRVLHGQQRALPQQPGRSFHTLTPSHVPSLCITRNLSAWSSPPRLLHRNPLRGPVRSMFGALGKFLRC
jgi:hypothetical protein